MKILFEPLKQNKILRILMRGTFVIFAIINVIRFGNFDYVSFLTNKPWWGDFYTLLNAITINIIAAYIFYILVVYYPEKRSRLVIKNNLQKQYRQFKEAMIVHFLSTTHDNEDDLETKLYDMKEFRQYFGMNRSERWYKVWDEAESNKYFLREILSELAILRDEVSFVLNKVEISDEQVFPFFKNMSQLIYRLEQSGFETDDDDYKSLARFIWDVFTGYSFSDGYAKKDIVQTMIDKI